MLFAAGWAVTVFGLFDHSIMVIYGHNIDTVISVLKTNTLLTDVVTSGCTIVQL